jgi:hypothetical protein
MRSIVVISIIVLSVSANGMGQTDSTHKVDLATIATVNQGNSYITFPTDIGNIEPLWFEANIIPNFMIRESKNARLMGMLTPQIIIRMYREESQPVRTPSYMPQITIFYRFKQTKFKRINTAFIKYGHHSNGQEGDFYMPDSTTINLLSGNFATNFLELGVVSNKYNTKFNAFLFFSTSFEVHPPGWSNEELEGKYSMVRWHFSSSVFKIPLGKSNINGKKAKISLKTEAMWMFGNINDWSQFYHNRFNFNITFYYHPRFLADIGFFASFYSGMDYYNIYFNHKITVLRFGIMTDILKF